MNLERWPGETGHPENRTNSEDTNVETLLRRAELDAEKTSAAVRVIVFLTLALAVFSATEAFDQGAPIILATALYGLGTAVGLVLDWRGVSYPVIPYLLVTFDVALVAALVLMLARSMGMQPDSPFALPAAALIFVILSHAAMRYRPWLVVYAAVLFVVAIELGGFLLPASPAGMMTAMHPMHGAAAMGMLNFQVLPLVLIVLVAFILFVIGRRTRTLLLASIQHGARAARLSRYFSPNLAARIAEEDDGQLLAGRRQAVAVVFVDIRGFSTLGETMPPDELGAFLSEYRDRLTAPIFARAGTVDKFIGDAIMAVFGSPIPGPDDAARAIACALDIIETANRWSKERERAGLAPVNVGIGAHYGEVFAGALGSGQLLEYTVIGDTVNIAERLEQLSREVDSPLVVSGALLSAAGEEGDDRNWQRLPPQSLKGHRKPLEVSCLRQTGT